MNDIILSKVSIVLPRYVYVYIYAYIQGPAKVPPLSMYQKLVRIMENGKTGIQRILGGLLSVENFWSWRT